MTATATVLLVEAASPSQLAGLGLAPRPAWSDEGGALVAEQQQLEPLQRSGATAQLVATPSLGDIAAVPAPSPADDASPPAAEIQAAKPAPSSKGTGLFGFFKPNREAEAATLATGAAVADEEEEVAIAQPALQPQPVVTTAVLGSPTEELELAAEERGSNSFLTWVLEKAALLAVGGVAGVALVRSLTSPASRAVELDAIEAAAKAKAKTKAKAAAAAAAPPPSAAVAAAASPKVPPAAAQTAPRQPPPPQQQQQQQGSVPQRAPQYGPYEGGEGAAAYGPDYSTHWDAAARAAAANRAWGRPPPGAAPPGPWPRAPPGAAPTVAAAGPGQQGPPATADQDGTAAYYGQPLPPWWRGPYANYEQYMPPYEGPYSVPPPPYGWEAPGAVPEAGPAAAGAPDPYYGYYGPPPPPGYYWREPPLQRRGPPPPSPYEVYDPAYGVYEGRMLPPPPPQARQGFAGVRAAPGTRLGRNPWAAAPSDEPPPQQRVVVTAAANAAAAAPPLERAGGPPGATAEYDKLHDVDDELAQLQAQIEELRTGGASRSAAAAAADSGVGAEVEVEAEAEAGGRSGRSRPAAVRGWRQRLEQEVDQPSQQPPAGSWRGKRGGDGDGQEDLHSSGGRGAAASASAGASAPITADDEYERLLAMWREAHPEDADALPGSGANPSGSGHAGGAEEAGRAGDGGHRDDAAAEEARAAAAGGVALGEEGRGAHVKQEQDAEARRHDPPAPPPVLASRTSGPAKSRDGGGGGAAVAATSRAPAEEQPAEAAAGRSGSGGRGGGPVGWFARMFQGRAKGKEEEAQQREDEEQGAPLQHAQVAAVRQPQNGVEHQQQEGHAVAAGDMMEPQRRPDLEPAAGEQLGNQPAAASVKADSPVQTRSPQQEEEELYHHHQQQQQPAEKESPSDVADAAAPATAQSPAAPAAAAVQPRPRPTAAGTAANTSSAADLVVGTAPNKEVIQQLKATSAAAADRAAETLARIRAMRAAAEAAGPRSGSGGKTLATAANSRSKSGGASERAYGSVFVSRGGNADGGDGGGVSVPAVGASKGKEVGGAAAEEESALAAEIAASQAAQSDTTTDAPGAKKAMGGLRGRQAAEVL